MNKTDFESKSLVYITLLGYTLSWLCGAIGFFLRYGSVEQIIVYQMGNAFAITASVMAGRYVGLRGKHVAASAYILLGITHGISLAALSRVGINPDRGMTMVMPMIPALICMFWCSLYPTWLRVVGLVPAILFALVYVNAQVDNDYFNWKLYAGYSTLQILEVVWGIFLLRDWRSTLILRTDNLSK